MKIEMPFQIKRCLDELIERVEESKGTDRLDKIHKYFIAVQYYKRIYDLKDYEMKQFEKSDTKDL